MRFLKFLGRGYHEKYPILSFGCESSLFKLDRSLAESENTRKQMEKIRIETNKYGVQPLAREILNVVDNFNRALNLKDLVSPGLISPTVVKGPAPPPGPRSTNSFRFCIAF